MVKNRSSSTQKLDSEKLGSSNVRGEQRDNHADAQKISNVHELVSELLDIDNILVKLQRRSRSSVETRSSSDGERACVNAFVNAFVMQARPVGARGLIRSPG